MRVVTCSRSASIPRPVRAETGKTSTSPASASSCVAARTETVRARSSRSTLLTTTTSGTPAGARRSAMKRSPGPIALLAVEHEQRGVGLGQLVLDAPLHPLGERVARALDARAGRRGRAGRRRAVATPRIARRVVWGLSETIATLWPTSALTIVDLPTFGRPARATKPARVGARSPRQDLAPAARASRRRRSRGPCPSRCRTPWTIASRRSAVRGGQITTSPSSRGPATTRSSPSTGNDSTSVGPVHAAVLAVELGDPRPRRPTRRPRGRRRPRPRPAPAPRGARPRARAARPTARPR